MKIFIGLLVVTVLTAGGFVTYLVLNDKGIDTNFLKGFKNSTSIEDAEEVSFNMETTKLEIPNEASIPQLSPNGRRLAYTIEGTGANKEVFVVIDGKKNGPYDQASGITFSADSKRVAYMAVKGNAYFAVVDGTEGPRYEYDIRNAGVAGGVIFDPTGKHVVYTGTRGGEQFLVIDEREQTHYETVRDPKFNINGELVAYIGRRAKKDFVVYQGKEGKPYDLIFNLVLSDNGNKFAYIGTAISLQGSRANEKRVLVVDGKEESSYKGYSSVALSPDGSRLAFGVTVKEASYPVMLKGDEITTGFEKYGTKQSLVVRDGSGDHVSGKQYENISFIAFSPDGKRIAYQGRKPEGGFGNIRTYTIVDEKEFSGAEYRNVGMPVFDSRSLHILYLVHRDGNGPIPPQDSVVVDGRAGKFYDYARSPAFFSPEGDFIGYIVRVGKEYTWIVERIADRTAPVPPPTQSGEMLPKSVTLAFNPVTKKSPPYQITFTATLKNFPSCGNSITWYFGNSPTEMTNEPCTGTAKILATRTIERSHIYSEGTRYQALVEVGGIKSETKIIDLIFSTNTNVIINLPNGGEVLPKGKPYWMSWGGSSVPPFDIYLLKGGVRVSTLEKNYYGIGYTWHIPSAITSGSDYKIEVVSGSFSDTSDGFFSIE